MKNGYILNFFSRNSLVCTLLMFLVSFSLLQTVSAQCSLSCESLINVSLNQNCEAELLPDIVLNGSYQLTCPGGVLFVQAKINGQWQPAIGNFIANASHIGKTLEVRVRDIRSGNSCWGHAYIEDKLPPTIACNNVTVSCAITDYSPSALKALGLPGIPVATDNCSSVTTTFSDVETVDVGCTETFNGLSGLSYAVKRVWTATDAQGMSSSCAQWIYFQRISPSSVIAPRDTVLNCTRTDYSPAVAGAPYVVVGGVRYPMLGNNTFCEIHTTYQDQVAQICAGTKKILRTWTIMDWCAPAVVGINPRYVIQTIRLEDKTGPSIVCPANVTISNDANQCCAVYNLPDVIVTDDCSTLKLAHAVVKTATGGTFPVGGSFSTFPGNNLWNPDTLAVFNNTPCLPLGLNTVTYTVTDDCNNASTCSFTVMVADYQEPTVVCDQNTVVSLGKDDPNDCYFPNTGTCRYAGVSWVRATTFDDGSYDGCHNLKFTVQRMAPYSAFINSLNSSANCNEYAVATAESDSIKFYCGEAGTTQMVIFRAYKVNGLGQRMLDANGQPIVNSCMVEVLVQDKQAPTCIAPQNVTVTCEAYDPTLTHYGNPTVTDNCCLDTTYRYNGGKGFVHSANLAQFDTVCNRGSILRTFTAYDCNGLTSRCTQRVTVNYNQDYFMHLPADVEETNCSASGNYGVPTFFDKDCELIGTSFQDDTLRVVPDACLKIIRRWKIANWCTFNADLPCISIPNPTPHAIANHPSNLNAPVLKVTPYTAGDLSVPADWRSSLIAVNPGEPATDYSRFWSADANCYSYSQIIKVVDGVKPVIDHCPPTANINDQSANDSLLWNDIKFNDPIHGVHDLCEAAVDLNITGSDACAGANVLAYYLLFLDTNGDGVMETVVNSLTPPAFGTVNIGNATTPNYAGGTPTFFDNRPVPASQRYNWTLQSVQAGGKSTFRVAFNTQAAPNTYVPAQLPAGTHKIKWILRDGCGNEQTCEYPVVIRDTKAPTIVCLNGVSLNIMPTGIIDIWDTDLYQYVSDNCTPSNQIKTAICRTCTSFPTNAQGAPIKAEYFDCFELGTQVVKIWAQDKMGNTDYCETVVLIQDNAGNCTTGNKSISGATKGTDKNGNQQGTAGVTVNLNVAPTNSAPGGQYTFKTDNQGLYAFLNAVPVAGSATITPVHDLDHQNGVDMLDVLKVQRHILGIELIDNPYRQIAADVNNSRSITAGDIVELRKLILGAQQKFTAVNSWRFINKSFQFPTPSNPFATVFPEIITITQVANDLSQLNFEAVKSGDVTGNAIYNAHQSGDRSNSTLYLDAQDRLVQAGETVTLNFKASNQTDATQFTLLLKGCEMAATDLNNQHVQMHAGAMSVATEQLAQFSITLKAERTGHLSEMVRISDVITPAVAFVGEERQAVALRFNGNVINQGFELMQNVPNPVNGSTQIAFTLPEATSATLTFTTVEGKVLKVFRGQFGKGLNKVDINVDELSEGVILYQLDTPQHSDVKKMIVLK